MEMPMPTKQKCEKCGVVLATFGTSALCPKCLLREAVSLGIDLTPQPATTRLGTGTVAGASSATEKPGDRIDHYRLLQPIGEGGMGIVYLADQESPFRRRVALKIIKLGMDTKAVIARFE